MLMKLSFILEQARSGELASLSAINKTDETIVSYVNLGLIELFKRFNVSVKAEVVKTSTVTPFYTLRNNDINLVLSCLASDGTELKKQASIGDTEYDIKMISNTSFLLTNPTDTELLFIYRAAPETITTSTTDIELPSVMVEALLHYVGYRAHGSVDGNINSESNTHYMRFEKSCNVLKAEGYDTMSTELISQPIGLKGFA